MLNDRARVFYFVVPQPVKVRKYKVDKNSLKEVFCVAVRGRPRTTEQQNNRTTEQQNNRTTEQQNNR